MYELLSQTHKGLAMLSVLLTLGWVSIVLTAPRIAGELGRPRKLVYTGAMAMTGLTGLSGLVLVVVAQGTWLKLIFPWLGLIAVAGHGFSGTSSRRALVAGSKMPALVAASLQLLFLITAYGLMTLKPF
ncbi:MULTISPECIES: hypothetical protein [Pseudomonas]|uniref:Protoporphyrinogen IX oxidase n=1 Tax=Pseudomonas citronellolis TaxID=53408 RepID=A0A1A9KFC1_9PSED|nr:MULTISPECIES: hypothetical protein [Pseudomonas]ANI16232.1 hypothetical protein A9C11_20635 [Pseudomonas citronellolis]EJU9614733.1 hypothetical protein [Pseudomonas aeruginosa]EKU2929511.1 hypothetical protein [Pseudomonas aeruginosa]ELM0223603.1 hypothetical protein [Pseudomonas aeruginosa]KSE80603.1 hypothetical protein AO924_21400 [Pseudomonas aeruginosa]